MTPFELGVFITTPEAVWLLFNWGRSPLLLYRLLLDHQLGLRRGIRGKSDCLRLQRVLAGFNHRLFLCCTTSSFFNDMERLFTLLLQQFQGVRHKQHVLLRGFN